MTYYASFIAQNQRISLIDMTGQIHDLCEEFLVTEVICDLDTGDSSLMVEIIRSGGSSATVELPRREASINPLPILAAGGLSVANVPIYTVTLTEILHEMEKSAPVSFRHSKLGFQLVDGKKVFLAAETATPKGVTFYKDGTKLAPRGTFEAWREGIIPFIEEKTETILALAMGASAPVASMLETVGVLEESMLWALIGASSQGKTSALKLSSSVWGVPSIKGLIDTLLDTENYFIATIANKNGFPHFIDETSACRWDFTRMIYNLAMSCDRGRCNSNGTAKPIRRWSAGTITFTGEKSMLAQSNQNGGLFARLLEFDFTWTKDAASAEKISRFVIKQHGTAGQLFIEMLQTIDEHELADLYYAHLDSLKEVIPPTSGIEERIIKKLAVLRLTIQLMECAWDIPVDQEAVDELLNQSFAQNAPKADRYEALYETMKQYIVSHENLFPDESILKTPQLAKIAKQGVISQYKYRPCIWIMSEFFDEFLDDHGIAPTSNVLHAMKDRQMIAYFGDRFKKKKEFGKGRKVSCYCLLLDCFDTTATPKTRKRPIKTKIKDLLSDEEADQ